MRNDGKRSEAIPSKLFHYTGVGAVLGMSKTRSLWASSAYYLNDSDEIAIACKLIDRIIEDETRYATSVKDGDENFFFKVLRGWVAGFNRCHHHVYLFSLSSHSNMLSQWRGYTPHGKGVCICFSSSKLLVIAEEQGFELVQCVYEKEEQIRLLKNFVYQLLDEFRSKYSRDAIDSMAPSRITEFLNDYRDDALLLFSRIKNDAFKEEGEWRIVSVKPMFDPYEKLKFREGSSMLVPYMELCFKEHDWFFDSVLLGPTEYPELSINALGGLVALSKLCNQLNHTPSPYREWRTST